MTPRQDAAASFDLLDALQAIEQHRRTIAELRYEIEDLTARVEQHTGIDYETLMRSMRALFAPAE